MEKTGKKTTTFEDIDTTGGTATYSGYGYCYSINAKEGYYVWMMGVNSAPGLNVTDKKHAPHSALGTIVSSISLSYCLAETIAFMSCDNSSMC